MKTLLFCFTLTISCLSSGLAAASEKAIFAGGCFWCVEKDFEALDGVLEAVSGFTGGTAENPTYSGNHKGHYEAVEITYDPDIVTYQELLDHFWVNHDPFDARGQFCDKGPSYLSAIFVATEEEQKLAELSKQRVVERFPNQKVVTPILELGVFYPIKGKESYHQDFYKKSPVRYKGYRFACGRDKRLREIWGEDATV
ncbi:MAG: peptide-methionine (S)-S-oxide reductase MsrA [Gammaproteobacteria bacterium]|nr:peptide-methionine (S)-S-oxide reductase MsrA [Gammaproteobacteria bacterium]